MAEFDLGHGIIIAGQLKQKCWSKSISNTAIATLVAGMMWVVVLKLEVCNITVRHRLSASWVIPQQP